MLSVKKQASYALLFSGLLAALSWFKISFIVGSEIGSFSLGHCLSPLIGLFGGTVGLAMLLAIRTIMKFSCAHAASSVILACHIPSFCAGLYLLLCKNNYTVNFLKRIFAALIALTCMILFCTHPVGSQAALYSVFWLIPFMAAIIPHKNLWLHALGSTFTAHAVGSVLWLYLGLVPSPAAWLALIPVMLLERLAFSFGIVICYKALSYAQRTLKTYTHALTTSPNN